MRARKHFELKDAASFKQSLLQWASQFEEVVFLDSNYHKDNYPSYDAILAVDAQSYVRAKVGEAFEALYRYKKELQDWVFGYLGYDLKNEMEALVSNNADGLEYEDLYFFQPRRLILVKENRVEFLYLDQYKEWIFHDFEEILKGKTEKTDRPSPCEKPKIRLRIHKEEYLAKVSEVLKRIQLGDIYEVNVCQEFFVEDCEIDPLATFENLNTISASPFAAFFKWDHKYALCASPERYLKRIGETVISQPIKGTAARSMDVQEDQQLRNALKQDSKEQAENVMIVDLVRNDLSKKSKKGSVEVEELFGIYTFKQVHQMISTVKAEFDRTVDSLEIIKDSFPMGSMTGAPKIAAMEIIEETEVSKRGLYSGAIGYFTPTDDFDFNVVIRSILFHADRKYVSYTVGGAITANSIPLKEYEECLLKAKAMRSVLESQGD